MGTYCALLIAVLFLFCYGRDFIIKVLSVNTQTDVIENFRFTFTTF